MKKMDKIDRITLCSIKSYYVVAVFVAQSCLTLCDTVECNLLGFSD